MMERLLLQTDRPVQTDFLGVNAIYHGFALMHDAAGRSYTEAQCREEFDRAALLGIRIARTYFRHEFVWNEEEKRIDWESEKMTAFCRWCREMQKRGIDIALNAFWWSPWDVLSAPWNEGGIPEDAIARYAAFFSEALHRLIEVQGLTNVKYIVLFTEPQNGIAEQMGGISPQEWWLRFARALHERLVRDGRRQLVKLVGPNEGSTSTSSMLRRVVPQTRDFLDVYSSHNYHDTQDLRPSDIVSGKYALMHGCPTHCRTQQRVVLAPDTAYEMRIRAKVFADFSKPMHGHLMFGALDLEKGSPFFKCCEPCSRIHADSVRLVDVSELNGEWQEFSFTFSSRERGECYIGFFFDVYQDGAFGLFDCVSLKKVGSDTELLRNGDFEELTDDWQSFGGKEVAGENYYNWERWVRTAMQYVPSDRQFWFDEYNWRGENDDPRRGTELAIAQAAFMNGGVQTSLLWSLFDQQWCDSHVTSDDRFFDGEHRWGLMPNLRRSTTPYPAFYAFGLLAGHLGGSEGTRVWAGEVLPGRGLYLTAAESPTGELSVLVVNGTDREMPFTVSESTPGAFLPIARRRFFRYLYDPRTVHPDPAVLCLASDRQMQGITDTLPGGSFAIYTTKSEGDAE